MWLPAEARNQAENLNYLLGVGWCCCLLRRAVVSKSPAPQIFTPIYEVLIPHLSPITAANYRRTRGRETDLYPAPVRPRPARPCEVLARRSGLISHNPLPDPRGPSPTPTMAQKPKVDPHVGRLGYLQALVTEFQETESQGEMG